MNRRRFLGVFGTGLTVALAGCGSRDSDEPFDDPEVRTLNERARASSKLLVWRDTPGSDTEANVSAGHDGSVPLGVGVDFTPSRAVRPRRLAIGLTMPSSDGGRSTEFAFRGSLDGDGREDRPSFSMYGSYDPRRVVFDLHELDGLLNQTISLEFLGYPQDESADRLRVKLMSEVSTPGQIFDRSTLEGRLDFEFPNVDVTSA